MVVVFGGKGFIGEYVVAELERRGEHYAVVDSRTSPDKVDEYLTRATHVIWLVPPSPEVLRPTAERCTLMPGISTFLYASTALLYGDSEQPQAEDAPLRPLTVYENAKYAEEGIVRETFAAQPEKLLIARLGSVYGDRKNKGIVGVAFQRLTAGTVLRVNGDGTQRRDLIHVEDVARSLITLLFSGTSGVYNVSTSVGTSLLDTLDMIRDITGKELAVAFGPAIPEKHAIVADNAKFMRLAPNCRLQSLREGLTKTYDTYRSA